MLKLFPKFYIFNSGRPHSIFQEGQMSWNQNKNNYQVPSQKKGEYHIELKRN